MGRERLWYMARLICFRRKCFIAKPKLKLNLWATEADPGSIKHTVVKSGS